MDGLISAGLLNAALATLLAGFAIAVTAAWKNPYVARLAWLAVLLKLLTPPLLFIPVEVAWLPQSVPSTPTVTDKPVAIDPSDSMPIANNVVISAAVTAAPATSTTTQTIAPSIAPVAESTASLPAITPHAFPLTAIQTLALIWIVGSLLLSLLALTRITRLHRCLARALPYPSALEQRTAALAAELNLSAPPSVCIIPGRIAPFAWSLGRRATIVLPAALVDSLDADALDAVIAHELTHLRRRDGWARWLELAATIAYWWCPTAWFARRRLHAAEEECCDADVLRKFPALRRGYGQALLQTLDLLAGDAPLAPGATGWGSRRSLRRRFERIGKPISIRPLSKRSRVSFGAILIVTCLLAPTAVTSEPAPPSATPNAESATNATTKPNADNSEPCTITLKDGTIIHGLIVDDGQGRVVVQRTEDAPTKAVSLPDESTKHDEAIDPDLLTWDLTDKDCLRIALENRPGSYRILQGGDEDAPFTLVQTPGAQQSLTIFQRDVEQLSFEVLKHYWDLALCAANSKERYAAQAKALQTWRQVKAKHSVSAEGGSQHEEAQARGQYYQCRSETAHARAEYLVMERKLRKAIGLASGDGRLINSVSVPISASRPIDNDLIKQENTAKRVEIREQQQRVEEQQRLQQAALKQASAPNIGKLERQQKEATARHHELLAQRESTVLEGMLNSARAKVGHASLHLFVQFETTHWLNQVNAAAIDEINAIEAVYTHGRASLDQLLQSQQRAVDAACKYQRSRIEYQVADLVLRREMGTLLEQFNIRLAE